MPELPGAMRERFVRDYALTPYDAQVLTATRKKAQFFEEVARLSGDARSAANWITGELSAALNEQPARLALGRHDPTPWAICPLSSWLD
jgi:aspartyl-tRNA(Asn)/glutamyl-tRNA(Gln) amidotransferase subunit B